MSPYAYLPMLTHLVCHHTLTYQFTALRQHLSLAATGDASGVVRVWDLVGESCLHQFEGHVKSVSGIVALPNALPDGRIGFVSAGELIIFFNVPLLRKFLRTFCCANPAHNLTCPPPIFEC